MAFPPPSGRRVALVLLAFAVLAGLAYAPSLGHRFLNWDDPGYILDNPELALPWHQAVVRIFTTFHFENYNPLHRLACYVEWRLSGGDALLFRVASLLLHVADAGLVWLLLREWLRDEQSALLGAGLFLLLPANVENVAWIAERKTLLATGAALLAAWLWLRERPGPALAVFAVGLLCKTSIVVLPLLLVLFDREARRRPRYGWYAAFCAPALAAGLVQIAAARGGGIVPPHGGSLLTHAMTVIAVLPAYALQVVLPFGHTPRHLFPPVVTPGDPRLLLGLLTWAAAVFGIVRSWRGDRRLCTALGFALAALHLTLVVPIPIVLADRYLYLATPLLLGLVASRITAVPPRALVAARVATAAAACCLLAGTFTYAAAWRDSTSLWTWALAREPGDREAWVSLAAARLEVGDASGAEKAYHAVLARDPHYAEAVENLATLELQRGAPASAAARLELLLRREPRRPRAWNALAAAHDLTGDTDRARRAFADGQRHCPGDFALAHNHARFHQRHGEADRARDVLHRFLRAHPDDVRAQQLVLEFARPSR